MCRRGLNGRSLPHSQSTLLRRASPAGQPRRADGALVRSFYPLETCDGVSTRRFWAWQGQHQGAKMVSDPPAAPPKRPALPASPTTCPQRHSGTAARVLWCSRPCPSESRPSVGPRAALAVIGHRRRQAAQRLALGRKWMGLLRRTIHQVGELSSRRLCSRYESRGSALFDELLCFMREK